MSFLDRIRNKGKPKTPQEADALAIRQLAGRGADLSKPRHVIHFLYFTSEAAARAPAAMIDQASWTTAVNPPDETIEEWSVRADGQRIVGAETISAFRSWFERGRRGARRRIRRLGGRREVVTTVVGRYPKDMLFTRKASAMPTPEEALPGRDTPIVVPGRHLVLGTPIGPPFPEGTERAIFGMGCFWGAERMFWQAPGMYTTAAGYAAGYTPNPTYQEVCTGRTGHNEVVLAVFDTSNTTFEAMLRIFWEGHDPTQGMRQGNDVGTQYRSGIYWTTETQRDAALSSRDMFQEELSRAGYGTITTEIAEAGPFYYAEDYHQQYLEANPNGYCGHGETGVSCPVGFGAPAAAASG